MEKCASQEKLKEQLLRVSDYESRMDQLRFEPAPNTITLSGLRTRVKTLTEELEEAKGHVHLKSIEVKSDTVDPG